MKAVLGLSFLLLGGFLLYEIVSGNAEAIAAAFKSATPAPVNTGSQNVAPSTNSGKINQHTPQDVVPSTKSTVGIA